MWGREQDCTLPAFHFPQPEEVNVNYMQQMRDVKSVHTHDRPGTVQKDKGEPGGPPRIQQSITPSMRQDSLFVVACVCCQWRLVSAYIHLRQKAASAIHLSEAFFRVTAVAGAPAGGTRHGERFTEVPRRGKNRSDAPQVIRRTRLQMFIYGTCRVEDGAERSPPNQKSDQA